MDRVSVWSIAFVTTDSSHSCWQFPDSRFLTIETMCTGIKEQQKTKTSETTGSTGRDKQGVLKMIHYLHPT